MNIDNAARMAHTADAYRGIHLVYSRDWKRNKERSISTMQTNDNTQPVRHIRESHAIATLSLAGAALVAPLVWVGHAVLRWLHVI